VTYPSTHGVFEEAITEICQVVHQHQGQVYLDGQHERDGRPVPAGRHRGRRLPPEPAQTFCIPHGGGGPAWPDRRGEAPRSLPPGHVAVTTGGAQAIGAVASAPWGSASILPISMMYIMLLGGEGLTLSTKIAILNANYVARRLDADYPVLYKGSTGRLPTSASSIRAGFKLSSGVGPRTSASA